MKKFKCEICGKNHNVYAGLESPEPSMISDIPEEERTTRLEVFEPIYIVDGKYFFINGYILIHKENEEEPFFVWQVWMSVALEEFRSKAKNFEHGKVMEIEGHLEIELPFYENSKDMVVKAIIDTTKEEVLIEAEEGQLKQDQSKPITKERVIEIMQRMHHPELHKEKTVFDKPFETRLSNMLDRVEHDFIAKDKDFVINIASPRVVLFQVVSRRILESTLDEKRGFGLHLSFDDSFEESLEEIKKFRATTYSNDFQYYDLDNIPTYQIDVKEDKKQLEHLVKKIVQEVYQEDAENIELDVFEI